MATLAAITVAIRANATKFTSALKKSRRQLRKFAASTKKASKLVGSLFKKVSATALIGGGIFAVITKQSLSAIDNLGKLSTRLGLSTKALSEYRLVAEKAGISFQNLTLGFQRMTRRVAEAAVGLGEARGAIEELGLDARELSRLSPDQQFEAIADAIQGVSSQSDKLRIAFKLFDSEGVAVLQTMQRGAAGIRAVRDEAVELGLSLSNTAVRGVERANDAFTSLGSLFIGLRDQVTSQLAPAFETLTAKLKDTILESAKSQGGIGKLAETIAKGILTTFKSMVDGIIVASATIDKILVKIGLTQEQNLDNLELQLERNKRRIQELSRISRQAQVDPESLAGSNQVLRSLGVDRFVQAQEKAAAQLAQKNEKLLTQINAIKDGLQNGAGDSVGALQVLSNTLQEMSDSIGGSSNAIAEFKQGASGLPPILNQTASELDEYNKVLDEGTALMDSLRTPLEIYEDGLLTIESLYNDLAIDLETYNRAIAANKKQLDDALDKDKIDEAKSAAEELGLTFSSAFEDAVVGGKKFSEVLKGLASDIQRIVLRKTVTEPLANSFTGLFENFNLGNLFNFGGARASGGPVSAGSGYLVGENGPEFFAPGQNGTIIPNNQLRSGAATVNNYFTVSGQTDQRSQQQIAQQAYMGTTRAFKRNG